MGLGLAAISAGVGVASSAAGTVGSFAQAAKQKKLQRKAEAKAREMVHAARKKLNVNFYDELAINKEPYELQREAMLQQGANALQGAMEGESRGAAAAAGRIQMAMNKGQGDIRSAMGDELFTLDKLSADEDTRLRDAQANLDLSEASGAQLAASEAENKRNIALGQGFQGAIGTINQGLAAMPLYTMDNKIAQSTLGGLGEVGVEALKPTGLLPEDISAMSPKQFRQWKRGLPSDLKQSVFGNEAFLKGYETGIQTDQSFNPFFYDFRNTPQ